MEVVRETPLGKPRRPHHKSRTGCLQCKQRKVKCDETKPICKKCENHNQSCSYLQTHPLKRGPPTVQSMLASPSPTSSTPSTSIISTASTPNAIPNPSQSLSPAPPANFTMLDLEILHFWTTHSVESFVDFDSCITLFRTTVVELAIIHPFLMHEILALSALHLSHVRPHKSTLYRHASDIHLATALALFHPEIAALSAKNCDACFAFSTMIFTHAWASQPPGKPSALFFSPPSATEDPEILHVQWIKLHRGSHDIILQQHPGLKVGPLEPLFAPWVGHDPTHPQPLPPMEEAQLSALPSAWHTSALTPESKTALDAALQTVRRVFGILVNNPEISKLSSVMAWFSMISEEFLRMLERKVPEALLLVAYYCVALKKAENMWWVRGKGENLLRTVVAEVGLGWERYTRWPVEQVLGVGGSGGEVSRGLGRDFSVGAMLIDE